MRAKDFYAFVAALLPVSLGLGLIYLYAVGRIGALAALATVVGLGVVIVAARMLAEMAQAEEDPPPRRRTRVVRL